MYTVGDAEAIIEESRPLLAKIVEVMGDSEWIAGQNLTWLDFYFAELIDLLNVRGKYIQTEKWDKQDEVIKVIEEKLKDDKVLDKY